LGDASYARGGAGFLQAEVEGLAMPSATYDLFRQAMAERKQIICRYHGKVRSLCPIILGHTKGEEKALTFQFGGESTKPLPPGGAWRCMSLSEVADVALQEGPWRSGAGHSQTQSCVEVVDFDVNPLSPYDPKHQL
jgi:hypothetical protein